MPHLRWISGSSLILNSIGLLLGTVYRHSSHHMISRLTLSQGIVSCVVCSTSPCRASCEDPFIAVTLSHLEAAVIAARSFPSVNSTQHISFGPIRRIRPSMLRLLPLPAFSDVMICPRSRLRFLGNNSSTNGAAISAKKGIPHD